MLFIIVLFGFEICTEKDILSTSDKKVAKAAQQLRQKWSGEFGTKKKNIM